MGKIDVVKRNFKILGLRYVLWDLLYQPLRKINNSLKRESERSEELIIRRVNNYKMWINKSGKGIHRDLRLNSIREPVSTEIVKSLLKKGDVVLEAGANIGYYTILESKIIGKEGIVYAVEPVKENLKLLKKNIKLNDLKNVKTYDIAFCEKEKEIEMSVSRQGNLHTPRKIIDPLRIDKIKGVSLDHFFKKKRKPNFMRMDIEGFEDVVFSGGMKTLDHLQKIFVELHFAYNDSKKMVELLKLLKKKDFEIYKAVIEWERWESEENFFGKIVNYVQKKRSRPLILADLTIDKLMNSKDFLEGHWCLEVFFVKK